MTHKVKRVVLAFPKEVWRRVSPEMEAMVLMKHGLRSITNLKEGIIYASSLHEDVDPAEIFDEQASKHLYERGIIVTFELA